MKKRAVGAIRACEGCSAAVTSQPSFSMAFQPIIEASTKKVFAHEALVRGVDGSGALSVLSTVNSTNRSAIVSHRVV